jgi:Arm DNA-binding domain
MSTSKKLTDAQLRAWLKKRPAKAEDIPDGSVSGLCLRLSPFMMTWSLRLRVKGEGGVSERGQKKNGKLHRVTLGEYPEITLDTARALASTYLDQARRGISPVKALEAGATAGGLTVAQLAKTFIDDYAKMRV